MKSAIVVAFCAVVVCTSVRPVEAAGKDKPSWLPSSDRALMVASAGENVTLSWKSHVGRLYTIMYTDKPEGQARWLPLPGYILMPGNGRTEELKLKADPSRPRRYNLHVEDAKSAKRAK